ncbi:MAG: hypothetical protein ABSB60_14930 [Terracidiphilus sp.]|jgi:hypothetical protein
MNRRKPRNQERAAREGECIEFSNQTSLPVEEEGICATFVNPHGRELRKIQYDKCYFRETEGGRADFIIGYDRDIDVILELKGSDLKHALIQVTDTLERWKTDEIRYKQIVCLIVYGHTFPRARSNRGAMERDFLDWHHSLLWIRQNGEERFNFRKLAGRSK